MDRRSTLVAPDAPPELVAKLEEIKQRYGIRELQPGVWGIEEETAL
jgi:hypothetical protein